MREIKYRQRLKPRFKGLNGGPYHYWGYIDDGFVSPLGKVETIGESEQFIGIKDKNDVEIYDKDFVNVCFTSEGGEFLHDCVYQVRIDGIGGIEFDFIELLWMDHGHNQYPVSTTLCLRYGSLGTVYEDGKRHLIATVDDYTDHPAVKYPFNEEKTLAFASRYFEVIDNPELLERAE